MCNARAFATRKRNSAYVLSYLVSNPCTDCGEPDPVVLEFDHVSGEKCAAIANLVNKEYSIATIAAEIAKCVVRCANCHRRKTAKQFGHFRYLGD